MISAWKQAEKIVTECPGIAVFQECRDQLSWRPTQELLKKLRNKYSVQVETGFHHVDQASPGPLTSGERLTLVFQSRQPLGVGSYLSCSCCVQLGNTPPLLFAAIGRVDQEMLGGPGNELLIDTERANEKPRAAAHPECFLAGGWELSPHRYKMGKRSTRCLQNVHLSGYLKCSQEHPANRDCHSEGIFHLDPSPARAFRPFSILCGHPHTRIGPHIDVDVQLVKKKPNMEAASKCALVSAVKNKMTEVHQEIQNISIQKLLCFNPVLHSPSC
ncbi:hypothetical protein AAY473_035684 [Plecturocebus cupreus]